MSADGRPPLEDAMCRIEDAFDAERTRPEPSDDAVRAAEALLLPHLSYLKPLDGLLDSGLIKGLAHITGGGLTDNIPRILPEGTAVKIRKGSWPVLAVFDLLRELGNVSDSEMYRTFNMGVGMVIICAHENAPAIADHIRGLGNPCYGIGEVVEGDRTVSID